MVMLASITYFPGLIALCGNQELNIRHANGNAKEVL
jgi:hypothetical protein